jgi:Tfp pilus assembly protein PilF
MNDAREPERSPVRPGVLISLALVVITAAVFWQVGGFDFINFDDDLYLTANPRVQRGLTLENIGWAFTTIEVKNWHPLAWLSHMLDVQLFGMNAGAHHLMSALLHILNALLVFHLLRALTGKPWRAGLVAALFAVHPLHVESVAWISERKDLLSTLFWLLALWAWARFVESRSPGRYAAVVAFFALGLMAKPMVVTLPFTLILLDIWPLKRVETFTLASLRPLVVEKLPLFAITVASAAITVFAQEAGGAVRSLEAFPLHVRVGNALVAYSTYLWNTLVPSGLAILYPHPGEDLAWWRAGVGVVVIGVVTAIVFKPRPARPWLVFGWLWYLGTLVPVIGIVQVGAQSHADRYTYVPLLGVFVILGWGLGALGERARAPASVASAVAVAACAAVSFGQVAVWKDSFTLFAHTLAVTEGNYTAHNNYANALFARGQKDEALEHYQAALKIRPDYTPALVNAGNLAQQSGDADEAARLYLEALRLDPRSATAHGRLGTLRAQQGKTDEAIAHYRRAIELRPRYRDAHLNLAQALIQQKKVDEAAAVLEVALDIDDRNANAWNTLGVLRARAGRLPEAAECFRAALRLDPDHAGARQNLARATSSS